MEKLRKFPKFPEGIPQRHVYAVGPFRIDPAKRLLLQDGAPIPLSAKDFELLMALIEHRGEVQIKEQLMQRVWPDIVVEEGNLNRHISTLRRILRESPNEHKYIVTVPGRGYQFVAEVDVLWDEAEEECPGPKTESEATIGPQNVRGSSEVERFETGGLRVASSARSLGTTKKTKWRAMLSAAVVIVSVAAVSGVLSMGLRVKPILKSTDSVLISDITNTTGDPVFDDTIKQALSVSLSESPFLSILSDTSVREALKLMTKPEDTRLTPNLARDICQRAGARVFIAGTVASLGSEYVIGLNTVDCRTGEMLAQLQVTAKNKEQVLKALDGAAEKLRTRLGESLTTMQKYDTPLEQATTSSLEALKAFTQGNLAKDRAGEAAAIPFFQHAIELDPSFALAYDALGLAYSNLDEPALASENIARAYALRNRASELEKFEIAANYSQIVTGELEKANQLCELWKQAYPRTPYPHNLLAVNFEFLGQPERAVPELREAIRLHPDGVVLRSDLMEAYTALNRLDLAKETYQSALDRKLDHAYLHADRYGMAFLENDRAEMDRQLAWAAGRAGAEDLLLSMESDTLAFFGNVETARTRSKQAFASALRAGQKETAALWLMNSALREAEFGNFERSKRDTAAALKVAPTRDVQVLAALATARFGDGTGSQRIVDNLTKQFPHNTVITEYWLPSIRAAIELEKGNPSKATEILAAASAYDSSYPNPQVEVGRFLYPVYLRGVAYLRMNRGGEAASEFRKFKEHRAMVGNSPLAALAYLGEARAIVLQGDVTGGRKAYQDFLAMWKDADPQISILRQAKFEYSKLP